MAQRGKGLDVTKPTLKGKDHWFDQRPVSLPGGITLHARGAMFDGDPTRKEWVDAFAFACAAEDASPWWVIDLNTYLEERDDWKPYKDQMIAAATKHLAQQTVYNRLSVGRRVKGVARELAASLAHASAVASLDPDDQVKMLEKANSEGLNARELGLEVKAMKRPTVIEGQATLEGMFPTIYADFPWRYGNRPPSGSGAGEHYPGMTVEEGCRLPVEAHASPNAVLFFWITAPYLYYATDPAQGPDAYRIIRAWGFTPKTGMVWDKVEHNFGNYVSIRHEHLIIATRGRCLPVRPTPMIDSVLTERKDGPHSAKPESFRKVVERLYDGPYLELFGRERVDGWTVFGNDARLWATQAEQQEATA